MKLSKKIKLKVALVQILFCILAVSVFYVGLRLWGLDIPLLFF